MEITDFNAISLKNLLADKDILRALFDALNISWFAVDKNGKVVVWNEILKDVVKKLFPDKDLNEVYVADVDNVAWRRIQAPSATSINSIKNNFSYTALDLSSLWLAASVSYIGAGFQVCFQQVFFAPKEKQDFRLKLHA